MDICDNGYIAIGLALAHLEGPNRWNDFEYGKYEERIKALGVETLIRKNGRSKQKMERAEYCSELENIAISHSGKLKRKRIKPVTKEDAQSAINFLEVLMFLVTQRSFLNTTGSSRRVEKRVYRGVCVLEEAIKALEHSKKDRKNTFKPLVKRSIELMDKLFAEDLTPTEKLAYGKKIRLAEDILKKYAQM